MPSNRNRPGQKAAKLPANSKDKPRGKATPRIPEYSEERVRRRRHADRCIAKRFYDAATPYIQIAGWLPVIGCLISAIYLICTFINNTQGYASQITAVDAKVDIVGQKVERQQDDIAGLKKGQDDIAREVHIIYSRLIGRPR